ncbi:MAG: hypothetical protein Q4B64_04455 [Spirochaetales bacterium]|nr:hypothetical protein [Spirochaetales bacterium]
MDDGEYYAMMRRQYSNPIKITKKPAKKEPETNQTPGTFSSWEKKYGHEDAEMFMERNAEVTSDHLEEE